MAQTISRLYAGSGKAEAAVQQLKRYGYGEQDIFVCAPGGSAEDAAASIAQAGIGKAEAASLAREVANGATLVAVHAPFGAGARAASLLDRCGPISRPTPASTPAPAAPRAASTAAPARRPAAYDEAAPLSSALGWSTAHPDPAPLSSYFKLPTLSDFSLSRAFGLRELSDEPAPLSKRFGWSLLRPGDPAPLSSKLNWPLLRE